MALPTLIYNATSGSDTAASGAGPATAVTGTAAAHTGGVSSTTITLTNSPDLSGVATDGSAVIWINDTAGNRHLSKITAVDDGADTVTVEDSFNIAVGSAKDYAIGAKRKTLENDTSNKDWADGKPGWTWEFEAGTYTLTATAVWVGGDLANGATIVKAASGASPVFEVSTNIDIFTSDASSILELRNLKLQTTGTGGGTADGLFLANNATYRLVNCTLDTTGSTTGGSAILANASAAQIFALNCDFIADKHGFHLNSGRYSGIFLGCRFHGCGQNGVNHVSNTTNYGLLFEECVFDGNASAGVAYTQVMDRTSVQFRNCVFHNNTGDGLAVGNTVLNKLANVVIDNCTFTDNGGYGINGATNIDSVVFADYNAFRGNTSGARNNISAGANDIALTADPYVDAAGGDFERNDTSGGGALLKHAGHPQKIGGGQGGTGTSSSPDVGVAQKLVAIILGGLARTIFLTGDI